MFLISVEVFICEAMISGGEESLKKKNKNQPIHTWINSRSESL